MSNKGHKRIVKLDIPYPPVSWPVLSSQSHSVLLELLISLIQPIGHHRRTYVRPSKGKRDRRKRKREARAAASSSENATSPSIAPPPMPSIASSLTVGINSTTRRLEEIAFSAASSASPSDSASPPTQPLAAVFVPLPPSTAQSQLPPIHLAHLPLLAQSASQVSGSAVRIVPLQAGAEAKLAAALNVPRVGCVGVMENASGAKALLEAVEEAVAPMEVPWLNEIAGSGKPVYLPPKVTIEEVEQKKGPSLTKKSKK